MRPGRRHFRNEVGAWLLLAVMMGAVEGGVTAVIAKTAFEGAVSPATLDLSVAILSGAPAFANVTSFLWAGLGYGRRKIRFLVLINLIAALLVGQLAFAPLNPAGLWMLMLAGVGGRVCWAGVVTLRATVWRANYPRAVRTTLAGRIATGQAFMLAAVGLVIGVAMNHDPESFRILYPAAMIAGLIGAAVYGRTRMRGHDRILAEERARPGRVRAFGPAALLRVLRDDAGYRGYMLAMFVFGIGNLAIGAPLVIMLREVFGLRYLGGILATTCIPIIVMPLAIPFWSRLLARRHIVEFRTIHCWAFVAATAGTMLSGLFESLPLVWISSGIRGIAFAGGVLGWNLGHLDYARPEQTNAYMGVHVTLTGVRGLIAPGLAVAGYAWLESLTGNGSWVFAICLALNLVGSAWFYVLAARHRRQQASLR